VQCAHGNERDFGHGRDANACIKSEGAHSGHNHTMNCNGGTYRQSVVICQNPYVDSSTDLTWLYFSQTDTKNFGGRGRGSNAVKRFGHYSRSIEKSRSGFVRACCTSNPAGDNASILSAKTHPRACRDTKDAITFELSQASFLEPPLWRYIQRNETWLDMKGI